MGKDLDMAVYAAILGMSDDELITASFLPDADHPNGHAHPRAPRMRTLIRATVVSADRARPNAARDAAASPPPEETTLVRNVSERGMCLVLRGTAPRAGDIVIVRLPSLQEYRAQVRWSDGRACGVQLFEKLDVDALVVTTPRDSTRFIHVAGAPVQSRPMRAPMRPC
ncbi:PilZ domain-containing protein [Novosphingobium sp. BL-8H]|uniref:PilZ domain-containing protein n=1 Tax=Novosphingobium sp. BL-8H TaxID=3127640 RepID=UPI003757B946